MAEGSGTSEDASESRLVALALASALVVSGFASEYTTTFNTAGALVKLALGLANLAAIGWATSRTLGLERPRHLALASELLIGQVVALAYLYVRSALSSGLGLPGITIPEAMLAEGALVWLAYSRGPALQLSAWRPSPKALPSLTVHLLWLGFISVIAIQKLDLLNTPSSDPDIHAFYTKVLLERGHLYYDLMPYSNAWMVYPSGFSSLNFVLGIFSGLHPVQLVNIGPYLQFTLLCGAGFAHLSQSIDRSRGLVILGLMYFGVGYLCFNAVFLPGREMLEGTPRLAHSAVLFFPLFFALRYREQIARRPLLLWLPLCGVVTGMCINPTHAPAALVFFAAAVAAVLVDRNSRAEILRRGPARLAGTVALLGVILAVFLSTDPFYRSLFIQQSAPEGQVEEARNLTGDALSLDFDIAAAAGNAAARVPAKLLASSAGEGSSDLFQLTVLAVLVGLIIAARFSKQLGVRDISPAESNNLALAGWGLVCLVVHAFWSEIALQLAKPDVLQGALLVRYTESLQLQMATLFFAVCPASVLVVALGRIPGFETGAAKRLAVALVGLSLALGGLTSLVPGTVSKIETFYPKLRETSLGAVHPSDIAFIARARGEIGEDERVLLPGRLARTPTEDWIFTTRAGRAVPLFSDIRTSFFLGLDGWSFTAGAYRAHVAPPNFDPVWLQRQNVVWLIESGNFPERILARHYERRFGDDHAVLWRLRARDPRD